MLDLSRIVEGVIIAGLAAVIIAGLALARTVARLTGVVENGMTHQLARIEARVDSLYDRLVDK